MKASYFSLNKPSYKIDMLYLTLAITLLLTGAGILSLDHILGISAL
ncbi:MAG: hypothetical protein RXR36_05100 [Nitrososphaeria archaeon]|jgi:hypothetical protein